VIPELDLFTPLARISDPQTSHDAALRQDRQSLERQWKMIENALRAYGPMNYSQIDLCLSWDHPKAARRLHELVDQNRIRKTGSKTPTHTRSWATVYEAMQNVAG